MTVEDDGDLHGTAVVEAARLCAAAAPGHVLGVATSTDFLNIEPPKLDDAEQLKLHLTDMLEETRPHELAIEFRLEPLEPDGTPSEKTRSAATRDAVRS